jgi:CRP-like cAMP-binding protein
MSDFSNSVFSGQIDFLKTLPGELVVWGNDVEIARHGAGGYLGEMALIGSKPRSQKL